MLQGNKFPSADRTEYKFGISTTVVLRIPSKTKRVYLRIEKRVTRFLPRELPNLLFFPEGEFIKKNGRLIKV